MRGIMMGCVAVAGACVVGGLAPSALSAQEEVGCISCEGTYEVVGGPHPYITDFGESCGEGGLSEQDGLVPQLASLIIGEESRGDAVNGDPESVCIECETLEGEDCSSGPHWSLEEDFCDIVAECGHATEQDLEQLDRALKAADAVALAHLVETDPHFRVNANGSAVEVLDCFGRVAAEKGLSPTLALGLVNQLPAITETDMKQP